MTKYLMAVLCALILFFAGAPVTTEAAEAVQESVGDTPEEADERIYVEDELYTGYYMDSAGIMYIVTDGTPALKSGTVSAGAKYYSHNEETFMLLEKQTVFVSGEAYTGYYMDSSSNLYTVSDGTRSLKSGTVSAGAKYYSYNNGTIMTLAKQTVFVSGKVYTGYYTDSSSNLYTVSNGSRALKSGTVSAGAKYYSYNDEMIMTLAKQTVFVSGKVYTGYYMDSSSNLYTVSDGTRALKSGTVSAGAKYYSYNSGATLTLAKQTVFVSGKAYTGYYMDSGNNLYAVSNGSRALKSGTVSAGAKYYSYNSGTTLTLAKQTVFVSGKAYTGYYMDSGSNLYTVSNGSRALKSGTVSAGAKYYSYNNGKIMTLAKQTVFVKGKAYTGYYIDSAGNMYRVNGGTKTPVSGTLSKGITYYSYNDGKTMTLNQNIGYVNGKSTNIWMQVNGTWRYYNASGNLAFESNVLHTAWEKAQTMSSETQYLILVDTSNTRTMIFQGAKGNWTPVYEWLCSPGKPSTPTIKGTYTVKAKGYSFGSGYTCYYYTQFYGNYLFHSILYHQGTFNVLDGRLGQQLSHGCVRLSIENAKWIYDNVPKNTTVYTY